MSKGGDNKIDIENKSCNIENKKEDIEIKVNINKISKEKI